MPDKIEIKAQFEIVQEAKKLGIGLMKQLVFYISQHAR